MPRGRPRGFDRQHALHQAMTLFWEQGFEHTSMADLSAAMGLKPPSIYAAFGDKAALFKAAVALYADTQGRCIWSSLEQPDDTARQAIHNLLRATAQAYGCDDKHRGCMIVLAAPQATGANPAVCEELKRRRLANVTQVERRLRQDVDSGELPADLDCRGVARYFATVQQGMAIQARDGSGYDQLMAVADDAMAGWDALLASRRLA